MFTVEMKDINEVSLKSHISINVKKKQLLLQTSGIWEWSVSIAV